MTKRYSFPSETLAKELILKLLLEESKLPFDKQTVTESTHGIRCNILPTPKKDENGEDIIVERLTYDVDVIWKDETIIVDEETKVISKEPKEWMQYSVEPNTPNHNFK